MVMNYMKYLRDQNIPNPPALLEYCDDCLHSLLWNLFIDTDTRLLFLIYLFKQRPGSENLHAVKVFLFCWSFWGRRCLPPDLLFSYFSLTLHLPLRVLLATHTLRISWFNLHHYNFQVKNGPWITLAQPPYFTAKETLVS